MSSKLRKSFRLVHLWLGFSSGLVVFIIAITGALWSFEAELSDLFYSYRKVNVENKPILPVSRIIEVAKPHLKGINAIYYHGRNRSIEVRRWKEINGTFINSYAHINPYSGEVLSVRIDDPTFFDSVLELHTNLMLGEFGGQVVRLATLLFLLILVTGIVLWWPKNKKGRKQRLRFDWKESTKWRRKNFDLHAILGFYASWIILFTVITGLAWTFKWVDQAVYGVATLGEPYQDYPSVNSISNYNHSAQRKIEDAVFTDALRRYGGQPKQWNFYPPQNGKEAITLYLNPNSEVLHRSEAFHYDKRTARLLLHEDPEKMNNGQFIRNMYYDIHIGKALGFPGQLLVFFASLVVASLPVTGFLIWYGRKFKKTVQVKS